MYLQQVMPLPPSENLHVSHTHAGWLSVGLWHGVAHRMIAVPCHWVREAVLLDNDTFCYFFFLALAQQLSNPFPQVPLAARSVCQLRDAICDVQNEPSGAVLQPQPGA